MTQLLDKMDMVINTLKKDKGRAWQKLELWSETGIKNYKTLNDILTYLAKKRKITMLRDGHDKRIWWIRWIGD